MRLSLTSITRFLLRHILAVGAVVAVLVLIIGAYTIIVPRYRTVKELGGLNYNQKLETLKVQEEYLKDLQALRAELRTISNDDLARLDAVLPKGKDVPGIFRQMQAFAREASMELLSVSVADGAVIASTAEQATASNVHTLTVSVILGGQLNYTQLKNFLDVVSRQAPLLDLTAISHTPSSGSTPTSYSFSFRSYYLQQ